MAFLAPLFLLGALAAAIPVLLHLRRRERRNVILFPSLMFLRGAPPPEARRRRLDNLLLLALRVGIVLLLAFAFARPVVEKVFAAGLMDGGRDVVIVIDRSPSMRVGNRMSAARDSALEELERLGGRDRAAVIAFSDRASALTELTGDHGILQRAIRAVQPAGGATRYAPAMQLAGRLLMDGERSDTEVVLVGDLQDVGWSPAEFGILPSGSRVRVVQAGEDDTSIPVRPLALESRGSTRGERELATISVRSSADAGWRLDVDGRTIGEARTGGNGLTTASFAPLPLPERSVRATVPLESGGPDDAMRLVLERGRAADVAIVRPGGSSGDGFLAVALRASVSPPIATTIWRGSVPSDRELATISVVMLDDVAIGDGDAERLLRWVERGGGLVLGLGPNAGSLPASLASAAGLSRGSLIERATATVALVDGSHPAFQGTRAAGATALPGASLWRYHRLTPPGGADIIIRADDGTPLLVEQRTGRGRILTWASTFDDRWSDIVRHPGFVPLVHGVALTAAGGDPPAASFETGTAVDLAALIAARSVRGSPPADGEELTLAGPGDERQAVPVVDGSAIARLEQPGFYEVRRERGAESALVLAANVPADEWRMDRLSPDEIAAAVTIDEEVSPRRAVLAPADAVADAEREQRLWWWVLVAAGLMLAAEGALANRLARPYVSSQASGIR